MTHLNCHPNNSCSDANLPTLIRHRRSMDWHPARVVSVFNKGEKHLQLPACIIDICSLQVLGAKVLLLDSAAVDHADHADHTYVKSIHMEEGVKSKASDWSAFQQINA